MNLASSHVPGCGAAASLEPQAYTEGDSSEKQDTPEDAATMDTYHASISQALDAFEDAIGDGLLPDIVEFLPAESSPYYRRILCELVRVDIEARWERDRPLSIDQYLLQHPSLREDRELLSEICFEDFRQRQLAGETPSPLAYAETYQVDVTGWSRLTFRLHRTVADASSLIASQPQGETDSAHELRTGDGDRSAEDHVSGPRDSARRTFAGFQLLAEIGRGAIAKVFLASQGELANRFVVVKIARHFSTEPQTLSRLRHTNIMPIHSVHREGNRFAICMPFLGITTLQDLVAKGSGGSDIPDRGTVIPDVIHEQRKSLEEISGPFCPPNGNKNGDLAVREPLPKLLEELAEASYERAILLIFSRVTGGLAHAHQRGILHRDLKPANILLADDGEPMLLDFNLASDSSGASTDGAGGAVGGTLAYMSPEQLKALTGQECTVDGRADIYSLGVILFELLTGQLPFDAPRACPTDETLPGLLHERAKAPRIRGFHRKISRSVEAIIAKCMQFDPEQRYADVEQLKEDIDRQLDHLPLRHLREPSLKDRWRKWTRRHSWMVTAAMLAGILTVLLIVPAVSMAYWMKRATVHKALTTYEQFEEFRREASFYLENPRPTQARVLSGLGAATRALALYDVLSEQDWTRQDHFRDLPPIQQSELRPAVGNLLLLMALGKQIQAQEAVGSLKAEHLQAALEHNQRAESCFLDQQQPQSLLVQRSILLDAQGETEIARQLREQAESITPISATDHLLEAREFLFQREYASAASHLEQGILLDPERFALWYLLGRCHLDMGHFQRATECYSVCSALRPDYVWTYVDRGVCYLRERKFDLAENNFDRAIELDPENVAAYINRALARKAQRKLESAVTDLDRAIELDSTSARSYLLRSRVRMELGERSGARRDTDLAMRIVPSDAESWIARGLAKMHDDPDGALADFERAARSAAHWRDAMQNMAHVLSERLQRADEAIEILSEVVARDPDFVPARSGRSILWARQGRRDLAIRDAEATLEQTEDPQIVYQIAGVYALTSRQEPEDREVAFALLAQSLGKGFGHRLIDIDPDLEALHGHETFQQLVSHARHIRSLSNAK